VSEVKVGIGLHNKFHIEVKDAETGALVQEGFAENVVLDQGLDKVVNVLAGDSDMCAGYNGSTGFMGGSVAEYGGHYNLQFGGRIFLGSGVTAPDHAQTALATPVYSQAATVVSSSVASDQSTGNVVQQTVIPAGAQIGDVYREVGLGGGGGTYAGTLSTRALIVDGNGDPLTITKIDLQVVTVTSTVYLTLSHGYGANLVFLGTGTDAAHGSAANVLMRVLLGYQGGGSTGAVPSSAAYTPNLYFGSSATAPANSQAAVLTALTGSPILTTRTKDAVNRKVTWDVRIPASVTGTIREFGVEMAQVMYNSINSWPVAYGRLFRCVLPIGDNSPAFDGVFADDHIDKDGTNVVDVSFALQVGSV